MKLLKLTTINLLITAAAIVVIELLLSLVFYFHSYTSITQLANVFFKYNLIPAERYELDAHLIYKYKPGTKYGKLSINEQGFIAPANSITQTDDEYYDIFVFGGSTVAGSSLEHYDQTLTHHLQNILQSKDAKVRVINAGVDGYNATQQSIKLLTQVFELYEPDCVIFYDGWNDFCHFYITKTDAVDVELHPINGQPVYEKMKSMESFGWADMLRSLNLFRVAAKINRTMDAQTIDEKLEGRVNERSISPSTLSANQIHYAQLIAESKGVKFFHFTQPALVFKESKTAQELEASRQKLNLESSPKTTEALKLFLFERHKALLSRGINAVDLSQSLNLAKETLYFDECHLNDVGNAKVAKQIARYLSL